MRPESSLHRWHEHFETVLNTRSNFEESVIHSAEQHPVREELAQPLVDNEVMETLSKLKGNKAGGKTGILPEMLKCCGAVMMEYLLDLFGTDVKIMGKLFAKVIQGRLQVVVEDTLPDFQCGFRCG